MLKSIDPLGPPNHLRISFEHTDSQFAMGNSQFLDDFTSKKTWSCLPLDKKKPGVSQWIHFWASPFWGRLSRSMRLWTCPPYRIRWWTPEATRGKGPSRSLRRRRKWMTPSSRCAPEIRKWHKTMGMIWHDDDFHSWWHVVRLGEFRSAGCYFLVILWYFMVFHFIMIDAQCFLPIDVLFLAASGESVHADSIPAQVSKP